MELYWGRAVVAGRGELEQGRAVGDRHVVAVYRDDAVVGQVFQDSREGLGPDRQAGCDHLLGYFQIQGVPITGFLDKVGGDPTGAGIQAEIAQLPQHAMQALAERAEQNEAGIHRLVQHCGEISRVYSDYLGRFQGLGADRVAWFVQEQ